MAKQLKAIKDDITSVEKFEFEPIKGYPMLNWKGKRPFRSTQYYPAQLKEVHGEEVNGWLNEIYWGDNLQVMSHLLKKYRGKVKLVYIDPPFDSKADYKKKIQLKGRSIHNDQSTFEEKQYSDLWTNDSYLQFMYERLLLIKELVSDDGSIYVHCDYHKVHYLKCIMDEIFGENNFRNDIKWVRSTNPKGSQYVSTKFDAFTDNILFYTKSVDTGVKIEDARRKLTPSEIKEKYHRKDEIGMFYDGPIIRSLSMGARPSLVYEYKGYTPPSSGWRVSQKELTRIDKEGNLGWSKNGVPFRKIRPEDDKGHPIGDFWNDISLINSQADERIGYPTQKPEELIERILIVSSSPGDIVFDCFMGSGTTQAVAMKLGRKFLGADINLAAVQTTTKRLINLSKELRGSEISEPIQLTLAAEDEPLYGNTEQIETHYTGFAVYNVNHYDIFRNPIQAKDLLIEALEVQPYPGGSIWDGEKDGRKVKIMPINRIATKADLNEIIANIPWKEYERKHNDAPTKPVDYLTLVCMGHEPDLAGALQMAMNNIKIDIEVVDILRDKTNLEFKRDSEAKIELKKDKVVIKNFYPMNLLQKLSLMKKDVEEWRELVDSVMIDFNYDGAVFTPSIVDVPEDDEMVSGEYEIPQDAGNIKIKITDLLSETFEKVIEYGNQ